MVYVGTYRSAMASRVVYINYIHFSTWSLRSSVISVLFKDLNDRGPKCPRTELVLDADLSIKGPICTSLNNGFIFDMYAAVFRRPFVKWFNLCYRNRTIVLSGLSCLDVTLVYCGQTVGWIRMPLGIELGLGPGHIVLDGVTGPP